jgi:hypothetical protein
MRFWGKASKGGKAVNAHRYRFDVCLNFYPPTAISARPIGLALAVILEIFAGKRSPCLPEGKS